MQGVYIEDAEEGGLNVSADGWQPSSPPSPATPSPQLQIFTDWLRSQSVEVPPSKSLGLNHYKDGDVGVGVFPEGKRSSNSIRYCGSPTLRTNSANRGSERMGSSKKLVFKATRPASRS